MTVRPAPAPTAADLVPGAPEPGTPAALAARLRTLLDAGPPAPARGAAPAARDAAAQAHAAEVDGLRFEIAEAFAEERGWRATTAPLAIKELARRAPSGSAWHRPAREWLGALRHLTFYRDEARRAAAAVAHPFTADTDRDAIAAWAADHELVATFPALPSWEDPGAAFLAILEPASVPALARAPERPGAAGDAPRAARELAAPAAVAASPMPALASIAPDPEPAAEAPHPDPAPPTAPDHGDMRPVAPIDLGGAVPRDLSDEEDPHFDVVDPRELMVDEAYQRDLSPKSLALIRRIVEDWSWGKYKVPNCVRVDGRLHVIDGQHTAIAAASHPGIRTVLVLVSSLPGVADRAAAFVSHATNRLPATHLQIHRAALAAGDAEAVTVDEVCRRAGVELLSFAASDGRYAPRQTVAVVGLRRLIARRGPERSAEILAALAEADLAPITGDHLRLGEVLLCDPAYAEAFDPERLTAAMRGLTAKTQAEARELGIAQRLPAWRALAAVLYRNSSRPKPRGAERPSRRRATA